MNSYIKKTWWPDVAEKLKNGESPTDIAKWVKENYPDERREVTTLAETIRKRARKNMSAKDRITRTENVSKKITKSLTGDEYPGITNAKLMNTVRELKTQIDSMKSVEGECEELDGLRRLRDIQFERLEMMTKDERENYDEKSTVYPWRSRRIETAIMQLIVTLAEMFKIKGDLGVYQIKDSFSGDIIYDNRTIALNDVLNQLPQEQRRVIQMKSMKMLQKTVRSQKTESDNGDGK